MIKNLTLRLQLSDSKEYQLIHKETFFAKFMFEGNEITRIVDLSLWMKLVYNKKKEKIRRVKFYVRKDLELDNKFEKTDNIRLTIKNVKYHDGSLGDNDDHQFITEILVNDANDTTNNHYRLPQSEKRKIDDLIHLDVLDSKIVSEILESYDKKYMSKYGSHICKATIV